MLFKKLISVNGVGAKAGISILSAFTLEQLQEAIAFEDAKALTKANGVGKKIAERIVLELKDKFAASVESGMESAVISDGEQPAAGGGRARSGRSSHFSGVYQRRGHQRAGSYKG